MMRFNEQRRATEASLANKNWCSSWTNRRRRVYNPAPPTYFTVSNLLLITSFLVKPKQWASANTRHKSFIYMMCFYAANNMACKCWKWGEFRHSIFKNPLRLKFVSWSLLWIAIRCPTNAKKCTKTDEKQAIISQEQDKIPKWRKEAERKESLAKAKEHIRQATTRTENLVQQRDGKPMIFRNIRQN